MNVAPSLIGREYGECFTTKTIPDNKRVAFARPCLNLEGLCMSTVATTAISKHSNVLHQSLVGGNETTNDRFVPLNYEHKMYYELAYLCQEKKKKKKSVDAHTGSL